MRLFSPSSLYVLHPIHDDCLPKNGTGKHLSKIDLYGADEFDRGCHFPNVTIPIQLLM
jgi:hypothetical protein